MDDTVRCPWHHACFSLRTGEALRAPALDPSPAGASSSATAACMSARSSSARSRRRFPQRRTGRQSIVIVGGGAAGNAAAETLRREGYAGRITMLSADESLPCDRPNLSKGYLAGSGAGRIESAAIAGVLRGARIDLKLGARVASIDTASRHVQLEDGDRIAL